METRSRLKNPTSPQLRPPINKRTKATILSTFIGRSLGLGTGKKYAVRFSFQFLTSRHAVYFKGHNLPLKPAHIFRTTQPECTHSHERAKKIGPFEGTGPNNPDTYLQIFLSRIFREEGTVCQHFAILLLVLLYVIFLHLQRSCNRGPVIPLTIAHKAQISSLCGELQVPLSEYNFANLYLFRSVHQYRVVTLKEGLAIAGVSYDKKPFVMPLFHPKNWVSLLEETKAPLYPVCENWFDEVQQKCALTTSDADSDYIYDSLSIREYRGRHFDGQRNAIRRLLDDHEITVHPLSASTQATALRVVSEWAEENSTTEQQYEASVCKEAVLLAPELQLEGWVFEVDGHPAGLLIGSSLTTDMYCFHFEKSLRRFRGLSAYIFQTGAQKIDPKYRYVNWEQDLGDKGLRQAKESYQPIGKAKKGWAKKS